MRLARQPREAHLMGGDTNSGRHRNASMPMSDPARWEPVARKISASDRRALRYSIVYGRPLPETKLEDAAAWATKWDDKMVSLRPVLAGQVLMVVAETAGAVLTSDPLLLWLAPVLLFAAALNIWGQFQHLRVRHWLRERHLGRFRDL